MKTWHNGFRTEGMVCDDETGTLYANNEARGTYKYAGVTNGDTTRKLIIRTGENGFAADAEGITIYYAAEGAGYIICSSQGNSTFKVYERKAPHKFVTTFRIAGVAKTDGCDVVNLNLGPKFPKGLFCCHNGRKQPFGNVIIDFEKIGLKADTGYWNPRHRVKTK